MLLRTAAVILALLPTTVAAQSLAEQVLEQTNAARWDNGELAPLKGQTHLDAASLLHSNNMATRNFFMHCDPDTQTLPWDRMNAAGYALSTGAENIAAGSSTAAGVMSQWLNSAGHRANILSSSYRELGVGYAFDANDTTTKRYNPDGGSCTPSTTLSGNYAHYWTQNFGRRDAVYPVVIAREAYRTSVCDIDLYVYGAGFATQMRFSNNAGATWSPWQAYSANTLWNLSGAAGGVATVHGEIRSAGGTVRSASDSIRLVNACGATDPMRIFGHSFEG